jgi:pyridoxal phosphate enzyme (YggS family)
MISENIRSVQERIRSACRRAGRSDDEITLVAVSKNMPVEDILSAQAAGIMNFGENRAQEMKDKAALLPADTSWHFIGHLQTNKVKYIIDKVSYIHSIDSPKLLETVGHLASQQMKTVKILIEVKTSFEDTKQGIRDYQEIRRLAELCMKQRHLRLCGLMTMAPFVDNDNIIRSSFRTLRGFRDRLLDEDFPVNELSMGMTGDFETAIEEGATMLRIGTAIFGTRS